MRHDFTLLSRFNERDHFQKTLPIINRQAFVVSQILLAGHVLAHIQNARDEDNRAFDDVGDVTGNAQEGHAGDDQLHHEHAEDNAADLAGAADERNRSDTSSGIRLIS